MKNLILLVLLSLFILPAYPLQVLAAKEKYSSTPLIYYAEGKYVACVTKSLFINATEYYNNGDTKAIDKLIKSGLAIKLKHGTEVFLLEVDSGIVKIRVKGEILELWTYREEIYF